MSHDPIQATNPAERIILARLSEQPAEWLNHRDLLPRASSSQVDVVTSWIAAGIIEEGPDNADRPTYMKKYRLADPARANRGLADGQRRERIRRLHAARDRARDIYTTAQAELASLHDAFTRSASRDGADASPAASREATQDLAHLAIAIEACSNALTGVYAAQQAIDSEERRYGPIPADMLPADDTAP